MFKPDKFVSEKIEELREKIKGRAIIACSGGVDSTTAAVLVHRAIGDNLLAVFVDTGFMRKNEKERISQLFSKMELNYRIVDASEEFIDVLKGVEDPERKRKIIGAKFIEVFEREAQNFGARYLVQGTIAPDWIESGGGLRDTIKSHHNVGGLPERMNLELVEPLRDLYKDEVRKVAKYLGLEVYERQPFPGPGLAIRIIGEVTRERLEIVREANAIVEEEVENFYPYEKRPWQYFAVLLPIRSVGVHGDKRVYGYTIAVRMVESVDGMTAAYFKAEHELLDKIAIRLTREIKGVNRVVYDITNKPPATIEWE
ncbi:MAG: glutamine-hydrolyzing GMP synthase subunit GuaA [Thermoplasmata archaeon]|nr:glutamine-hydrolyzing GMP synthase subunit GuaA [Thermoplasmata archaeon]